jgi:creatinine amidohydrolase
MPQVRGSIKVKDITHSAGKQPFQVFLFDYGFSFFILYRCSAVDACSFELFCLTNRRFAMRFQEMTWPMLKDVSKAATLVIAPIAACEQHSRHLPTCTDTLLVTAVAEAVEKRLPDKVMLLPTLWLGASHHHRRFGGTLSAAVDVHLYMLCDLVESMLLDGFRRVLLLNGHGGNIDTMQAALRRLQPRYLDRQLSAASYWDVAAGELAKLATGPRKVMGHACEFETSMVMALRPDLVRLEQIRDDPPPEEPALRGLFLAEDMKQRTHQGAVGYPELATPEKGRAFLQAATDRVVEVTQALLARRLPE